MFVAIFSIILIIIDQFTKYLVVTNIANENPIVLIDGFLRLYYIENRGAAFGILQGFRTFFAIITVVVLLVLIIFLIKNYNKLPFIYLFSFSLTLARRCRSRLGFCRFRRCRALRSTRCR